MLFQVSEVKPALHERTKNIRWNLKISIVSELIVFLVKVSMKYINVDANSIRRYWSYSVSIQRTASHSVCVVRVQWWAVISLRSSRSAPWASLTSAPAALSLALLRNDLQSHLLDQSNKSLTWLRKCVVCIQISSNNTTLAGTTAIVLMERRWKQRD